MRCGIGSEAGIASLALLAPLFLGGVAPDCSRDRPEATAPGIVRSHDRMEGTVLYVDVVCHEAPYEDAFVDWIAGRFAQDERNHPEFTEYRFRLSLIPQEESAAKPISVLFSYMFFDRESRRTSDVEAFEFLMPRKTAGAIVAADTSPTRTQLYEELREDQPQLNPEFARRLPPSGLPL